MRGCQVFQDVALQLFKHNGRRTVRFGSPSADGFTAQSKQRHDSVSVEDMLHGYRGMVGRNPWWPLGFSVTLHLMQSSLWSEKAKAEVPPRPRTRPPQLQFRHPPHSHILYLFLWVKLGKERCALHARTHQR